MKLPSTLTTRTGLEARLFTAERLNSPQFQFRFWLWTRLFIVVVWVLSSLDIQDVRYYYQRVELLADAGPQRVLIEYPTPVVWLLQIPWVLGFGTLVGYTVIFVAAMVAIDAAFTRTLWKAGGTFRGQAVAYWTLFLAFVGPTAYLRFDLVTAWLMGLALLACASNRERLAGVLTAVGAAIKLWPALLWPALFVHSRRRNVGTSIAFWAVGGGLALASLVAAGWDRLFTPLQWQSNRGLQVEAVLTTPAMIARAVAPHRYDVRPSTFQAYEIAGPGVATLQTLTSVFTALGVLAVLIGYGAWLRRDRRRIFTSTAIMIFVIVLMIVTNKTFSPQYIIWLGGPIAAGISLAGLTEDYDRTTPSERRTLRGLGVSVLALTLLTQVIYPIGYAGVVHTNWLTPIMTVVLTVRNLGIVALMVVAGLAAWRSIRTTPTAADEPVPERS